MSALPKSSPLSELRSALPSLPMRLQEVGRFVAANDYDATTRSMRDLAAEGVRTGTMPPAYRRFFLAWVLLGLPALAAFLALFWLMVAKQVPWAG